MRLHKLLVAALAILVLATCSLHAAEEVLLWPNGAPGSEGQTAAEALDAGRLTSVHKPSLTVYLPTQEKATGAAVIIMPGGGHRFLSIDNEGHACAKWLAEHGVAGLVLKYRLSREPNSPYKMEHSMQDAERAIRVARSRAKEWNLDPNRVGVIGFSAGGELAAAVGTKFDSGKAAAGDAVDRESSRPAFQSLIYAQIPKDVPAELAKDTPPAFVLVAADDKPKVGQDTDFFRKLNTAGISAELHVFAKGGHGFGMRDRPLPISAWPTRFYDWLDNQGFLKPPRANPAAGEGAKQSNNNPAAATNAVAAVKPAEKLPDNETKALEDELNRTFKDTVHPFLAAYCTKCHSGEKPKAEFDLAPYAKLDDVVKGYPHWLLVLEKLNAKEMPPEEAKAQPTAEEVKKIVAWVEAVRENETRKHAGDPGIVLARRLSNSELNYTIRDLTGFDIKPTREFPQDPANTAGFDNSGETLVMSPSLLNKYLKAAREVASHMFLKPDGFAFAAHPMLVETDRDKYCVSKIIELYHRQDIELANYFHSAWKFKNRAALGKPNAALENFAEGNLSAKYLATVWNMLEVEQEEVGPLVKLQALWKELPAITENRPDAARAGCEQMRDYVWQFRKKVEPRFLNLAGGGRGSGQGGGGTAVLIWKNVQYATHRMKFDAGQLQVEGEPLPVPLDVANEPNASGEFGPGRTVPVINEAGDPDLVVPAGERAKYEAAFAKFCRVFPDKFYMQERGRNYFDTKRDRGRYLSAGFHSNMGYFRDDHPLHELILDEKQQKELDDLWVLFDFMADATERMYLEGGAGRPARGAMPAAPAEASAAMAEAATSESKIKEIEARYVASAGNEKAVQAGRDYYQWVNKTLRNVEKLHAESEPIHLKSLLEFAERAYRRPLTKTEQDELLAFYRTARDKDGMDHESAIRETIAAVLMSPDVLYRIDLVEKSSGVHPLSDYDLASRLSYFLWSSSPDAELLSQAAAGKLHEPAVIAAQAKRMLKDARTRALAVEFGGNWLDVRHFDEISTVDRERFANFTPELRDAMFEEPVRFLLDVFQANRPITDLLYAKDTFVNPVLAKHYGMPVANPKSKEWLHIEDASVYDRGGLLPMAAFLTKNAPGLRTSPVKRGNWVVKNILGERIPPPPAVVPELPRDEAKADLPLREMLAQHRADKNCAGCHARFDSFGLVFEGFGPIGERREKDLAGRPVDVSATFPSGSEGAGLAGLRNYIRERREQDFVENFCGKLLACALGRSLILSDDILIDEMRGKLEANEYRFENMVESIVTSPQFLNKRGPEAVVQQ